MLKQKMSLKLDEKKLFLVDELSHELLWINDWSGRFLEKKLHIIMGIVVLCHIQLGAMWIAKEVFLSYKTWYVSKE